MQEWEKSLKECKNKLFNWGLVIMTLRKLASEVAKIEGKKSQARVGDIREILNIICQLEAESLAAHIEGPVGAIILKAEKIKTKLEKKKKI